MNLPRASVVIPNYNHAGFLPRCLDALLEQSVPAHEIIVVDDASTDHSLEVLEAYARRHPRVKVVRNEKNQGVCVTLNRGLELSEGEYVCFPAADDEVLPGLFEELLPLLAANPRAGAASGHTEWRCQSTGLRWVHGVTMPDRAGYLSPDDMIRLARSGRFAMSGQHMLYRRTALLQAGGWLPELRWFADAFGGWVVGFRHGVCHVPKVLSVFNLFPGSYYNAAREALRRETMGHLLDLLEGERYADVMPRIRASGLLGGFGPSMVRVVLSRRRRWHFIRASFVRHAARRTAEMVGRRLLPNGVARTCLRLFYGQKSRGAAQASTGTHITQGP